MNIMTTLVISFDALHALPALQLPPNWFVQPFNTSIIGNVRFEEHPFGRFVLTNKCAPGSKLLIISTTPKSLFEDVPTHEYRQVFDRCTRIALRSFDQKISLNSRWMPYHSDNRVSIFAYSRSQAESVDRIAAEVGVKSSQNVFIFAFDTAVSMQDLKSMSPDYDNYEKCIDIFSEISLVTTKENTSEIEGQIVLETFEANTIVQGFNYSDWYPNHLSKDQIRFVEHKLTGPLRLRGAAGTGKTLAMVIKALKTKYDSDAANAPKKIMFVTHSWAMADYIDRLISKVDINPFTKSSISVVPLLYLASNRDYSKVGREPLGIDSEDGKKLALLEILKVVEGFISSDWLAYKSGCSAEFIERLEASDTSREKRIFCWDLLVEFGCVIAAQGILTHATDRERYLRIKRLRWMMPLETITEKSVVFVLWVSFMSALRSKKWVSSDQIISDYLNDLSTYYWEAARTEEGYDVVFVDEMHLFNAQERLVFHNLLNNGGVAPIVVMALDPKQSPRETFTEVSDERDTKVEGIYERARLPNSEKIDLVSVYRYTPQIARVIRSVHDAAPGLDLSEDWDLPQISNAGVEGNVPTFQIYKNKDELFNRSVQFAFDAAKEAWRRKGRLAILCMDSAYFEEYTPLVRARYFNEMVLITSRDDTDMLRYAGKKLVFSTPEYVAGLQFDTVVVIDANDNQVPDGKYRNFQLRRFIAELYLGISRAQNRLHLTASKSDGGLTKILEVACANGDLIELK